MYYILCNPPPLSFAAGTTDGQGDLNFIQGITKGNVLWDSVKGLLGPPSAEQKVTLLTFIFILNGEQPVITEPIFRFFVAAPVCWQIDF